MIKKLVFLILLSAVALTPALAQEYRGNLYLTVATEDDGRPIVGAKVTLKGIGADRTAQTDDEGRVRFIKLEPGSYTVEVRKDGFNTLINEGVAINTGANVEMTVQLQQTEVVEEVTVVARTPVLDKRKTGTQTVVNPEEIKQIPTARDPWAVLATIPGIQTDRINVGGNQSGQQSNFVGKGDDGDNTTWVMDGVEFTDLAAQGGSSTYFDFNSFQEIGFTTGGGGLEQSTPGNQLNFTTKQGTNRHSGSIGLVFADEAFQDTTGDFVNPDGEPVQGNQIAEVFEKTFEFGGPMVSDKAWYWFGFSQNDVDNRLPGASITDPLLADRTKLQNVTAKLNGTIGDTSLKGFYTRGDKIKIGRNAGPDRPQPTSWDQSGPTPIYTFDVSHFFTPDFEISGQFSHVGGGFQLIPQGTAPQILWDSNLVWQNTFVDYVTERPTDALAVRGNLFVESGPVNHEIKFGFKLKEGEVQSFSGYGTQDVVAVVPSSQGARLYRQGTAKEEMEYTSLWAGDTLLFGNFTVNVGALWIEQTGKQLASASRANGLCPTCLPSLNFTGFDPGVEWSDILPRAGLTYTFEGARRQLIRFGYGEYVDQFAVTDVAFNHPAGPSAIRYRWTDFDGDNVIDYNPALVGTPGEVGVNEFNPGVPDATGFRCINDGATDANGDGWPDGPRSTGNVNACTPGSPVVIDHIDPDYEAPQVQEAILGWELEVAKDLTVGVNLTQRTRDRTIWNPLVNLNTLSFDSAGRPTGAFSIIPASDWIAGTPINATTQCISGGVTTATSGAPCEVQQGFPYTATAYTLGAAGVAKTNPSRPQIRTNRPGYEEEYESVELIVTKRLSNKWMLRAFATFQDWTKEIDCVPGSDGLCRTGASIQNPSNTVGDTTRDGSDVIVGGGTTSGGFGNVFLGTADWQYNINGLYQLPKNFTISANLSGREGYVNPLFFNTGDNRPGTTTASCGAGFGCAINDADGVASDVSLQVGQVETFRLDDLHVVDLKVAKLVQFGDTTVDLGFEVFNLFDEDTILQLQRRQDINQGTIFETLSPRIFRLSARVTFK